MPNWKKVLTSGSAGELASLYAPSITGSLLGTASFALTASYVTTLNQNVIITGSLSVGTGSVGPSENTLTLGARDNNGSEGAQIGFNAPGGTYTSASMIDLYQNRLRVLRGTNAGSDAEVAWWSMHTKQMALPAYNSTSAFPGTAAGYLAFDSSGNIITVAGSGGGGSTTPGGSNTQIQYNNSNTFGGVPTLTYDGTTLRATGSFTGSLVGVLTGTASYATQALSSSYAVTASYAQNALSSSYADTASFSTATTENRILVLNQSGYTINKGIVVHITASGNSSDIPRIISASYESDGLSANTLGIARETITNGSQGYVTTEGVLTGLDTSAYYSGQLIYLGTAGSITGSAPRAPLHAVRLGQVIREQSANGSIYVRIDNGYELEELHNVIDNTTTGSYGDLLVKSGSVWINSKQLTGSYGLTGSLQATSFTGSLFGTASWSANAITASYVLNAVSASFSSTASYVNPLNQNVLITGSVNVTQNITASRLTVSSSNGTVSGSTVTIYGSGSSQPVFTVQGSQGELFSITDSLSGSLFSVNDISGLPILEVFSDNTTLLGSYQDPMLITTTKLVTTASGAFTLYSLPTASYDTAFFEYSVRSGSNARAGSIMAIQSASVVNFTETTTTDFGSTSGFAFTVQVSGANMLLTGSATTSGWTIKTIVRSI